jgi:eukaryotic-like serine/threonine-protein kinase
VAATVTGGAERDGAGRSSVTPSGAWSVQTTPARAIGRYELLGEIATGGMATVYLGRMRRPMGFSRLVAIKVMHPQYAKDPGFVSMFVDEARITARLRHPNVVPTLDVVADDGQLVIVMEYVEGETLGTLVRLVREQNERIPAPIACAMLHDLLLGLHEAHEAHDDDGTELAIIHRDVSPQNVIVGLDGLTRVLDFGVAKARRGVHSSIDGEIKGKLAYMPPEQLFGEAIDRRVDVYAAGVLLWECLTGARLFDGPTDEVLVQRISGGDIEAPSRLAEGIPPELDAFVLRALSTSADARYASALAMAERLAQLTRIASRTEVAAFARRFARRREVPALSRVDVADPVTSAVVETLDRVATAPTAALARRERTRARLPLFVAIAGAAALVLSLGLGWRAVNAAPQAAAVVAAPLGVVATATAQATAEAARAAPSAEDVATPKPRTTHRAAVVHRALGAAAVVAAPPGVVAAPPAAVVMVPEARPSCRPPYTIDAEGHRHYKVECL